MNSLRKLLCTGTGKLTWTHIIPNSGFPRLSRCYGRQIMPSNNGKRRLVKEVMAPEESDNDPSHQVAHAVSVTAGIQGGVQTPHPGGLVQGERGRQTLVPRDDHGDHVTTPAQDLYRDIRRMHSQDVLSLVQDARSDLDKVHVALALRRLFEVKRKLGPYEEQQAFVEEIQQDHRFQVLCALAAVKGSFYRASVAFDILRFMTGLGLTESHPAVHVYLKLLQHHLSDLALDQLVQLAFWISKMNPTKDTELLKAGIRSLVPLKESELPLLTMWQRLVAIDMFGDILPEAMAQCVLRNVARDYRSPKMSYALLLLRGLSGLYPAVTAPALESACVGALENKLHRLTVASAEALLDHLSTLGIHCPDVMKTIGTLLSTDRTPADSPSESYSGDALTTLLSPQCPLRRKVSILSKFHRQSFVHKELLDSIALEICELNSLEDSPFSLSTISDILRGYFDANHVTVTSRRMATLLIESLLVRDATAQDFRNLGIDDLISMSLAVAVFTGETIPELVQTLGQSWAEHWAERRDLSGQTDLSLCEQMVLLSKYVEAEELPIRGVSMATDFLRVSHQPAVPLEGWLTRTRLAATMSSSVQSDSGLMCDYVVKLDDEGIQKQEDEEQSAKFGQQRIAVKVFPPSAFSRNTGQLRGVPYLYARTLQRDDWRVIVMNQASWEKSKDSEKAAYLRRRILQCDSYQDLAMTGADTA